MVTVGSPRHRRSIRASASRVKLDTVGSRAPEPGATDATELYGLYRNVGPIRYAISYKAGAAKKIRYYVAQLDDDDTPQETDNQAARAALQRLRGPSGDFADFVAEATKHWSITGEAYLVGTGAPEGTDAAGDEEWDIYSSVEYRQAAAPGYQPKGDAVPKIGDGDFVVRLWREDPEWRHKPDSPLRSVRAEAEQYVLLRDVITSISRSRLPGGLLLVDGRVELPTDLEIPNVENPDFFDMLTDAMVTAVQDTQSASRIVPVTLTVDGGPTDGVEKAVSFLDLRRDLDEWVPNLLEKVLRQIANGLDIPAEILLGLADVNHWGQWMIDDSARLNHADPDILGVLAALSRGYLQPALEEAGVPDAHRYVFWRDFADLSSRAVTADDARNAYHDGIIGADTYRAVLGFSDADAPDNDTEPPAAGDGERTGENAPRRPPAMTAAATPTGRALDELARIDELAATRLLEAAQASLDRALERAGAKIRTHTTRGTSAPQLAAAIDGVHNSAVGVTLGRETVTVTFQLSDDDLIPESAFDGLRSRARRILERAQSETAGFLARLTGGDRPVFSPGWVEAAVDRLTDAVRNVALGRLFTPEMASDPAETGEIGDTNVPAGDAWDALTVAGGGEPGPEQARGLANGQTTLDYLTVSGFQIRERRWRHGDPAVPFEPHRRLDDATFTGWTDDVLRTPPSASWLGVPFMFPGDHRGCTCSSTLVVAETAGADAA